MSIAIPLEPPSLSLFPSELLLSSKASLPSFCVQHRSSPSIYRIFISIVSIPLWTVSSSAPSQSLCVPCLHQHHPIPVFTLSSSPSQSPYGPYHIRRSQHDYRFPQINFNSKEVADCHRREKAKAVSPGRNLDPVIPVPIPHQTHFSVTLFKSQPQGCSLMRRHEKAMLTQD